MCQASDHCACGDFASTELEDGTPVCNECYDYEMGYLLDCQQPLPPAWIDDDDARERELQIAMEEGRCPIGYC